MPRTQELLPPSPAIAGRDAIRQFYAGLIERFPRFAHHFELEAITVAQRTADTLKPEQEQVGKFVGVWRRRYGAWWLVLNISNCDHPTP
jgi:hypothetical protein